MKATEEEKQLINERATELEKIGFVFKVSETSTWYEKGKIKMPATLMMCASEREWMHFVEQNK